jgi:SAM-dependent methyltransferase
MNSCRSAGLDEAYRQVERYYTQKLRRYGPSPLGVDWSCMPTQALRFRKLLTLCDFESPFSLNDIGCGYGALLDYLALYHPQTRVDYLGIDLSPAMVRSAKKRWTGETIRFHQGVESPRSAEYSIASGIFNVMLDQPIALWEQLIETTLAHLRRTSRKGFAVNFVHLPASGERARTGLYCTRPARWSEFCETRLSSHVRVIDNYGMGEFTLLIEPLSL